MANEAQLQVNLAYSKNGVLAALSKAIAITLATDKIFSSIQNVGTSAESILLGEVSNPAFIILVNLSTTNVVNVTMDGTVIAQLAGDGSTGNNCTILSNNTNSIRQLTADTNPCNVLVMAA